VQDFEDLVVIFKNLHQCQSADEVFERVDTYGKSLGFEASIMAFCGRLIIKSEGIPPYLTSASPEWVARYMELDLYSVDPITQMTMRSCRPFTYEEAYSTLTAETRKYQKESEYFAQAVPEIAMKMTDRERDVLTLVARGKTNWEIGTVLSISEYSVRDYLKTLSVKLRTTNRAHSVARAIQLGLIVP